MTVPSNGFPIVLAADRSLTASYDLLFDGMLVASQTTTMPRVLLDTLLMPRPKTVDGVRTLTAPCGLRRIEAALLREGFTPDDVVVVDIAHVREAIGPATRVVGISSGEPIGLGMNTNTMVSFLGGQIYPQVLFEQLLAAVRARVAEAAPEARILLGGPGAWQIAGEDGARRKLGIDHVMLGYAEGNIGRTMRALLAGEDLHAVLVGEMPDEVPPLRGAATMGVVEISRGCGLGCEFCTIADVPMRHLPMETILADARTNLDAGLANLSLLSEDFFRYGGSGTRVDPPKVIELASRVRREFPALRLMQIDHANLCSVAQYSDAQLAELYTAMVGPVRQDFLWVNVGVETASGALLRRNGGAPKMAGLPPEAWGAFAEEQVRRLARAGFFPLASIVIGLPGETAEDVAETLAWVNRLRDARIAVTPVLYASLDGGVRPALPTMSKTHWRLIKAAYATNFRLFPSMYADNQRATGVPFPKRLLLQGMGQGQVLMMKTVFAWHARNAR